ncbi:hypothetical protein PG988_006748 [Apiospora saccharicola]
MAILEDEQWEAFCTWVEDLPAKGALAISQSEPFRVGRLSIWLHDLSRRTATTTAPTGTVTKVNMNPGSMSRIPIPKRSETTQCSPRRAISIKNRPQRQFRPLAKKHLALLKQDKDERLWSKPDCLNGNWPSQTTYGITMLPSRALGYLSGCGSMSDTRLTTYAWNTSLPFRVPAKVELDTDYRGDAIMYGLYSPSANLQGSMQHWSARHFVVHNPGREMGAMIAITDGVRTPKSIDCCELHALMILLARQKSYDYKKPRLRAWLISI